MARIAAFVEDARRIEQPIEQWGEPGPVARRADRRIRRAMATAHQPNTVAVEPDHLGDDPETAPPQRRDEAVVNGEGDAVAQQAGAAAIGMASQPDAPQVAQEQPLGQPEGRIEQGARQRRKDSRQPVKREAEDPGRHDGGAVADRDLDLGRCMPGQVVQHIGTRISSAHDQDALAVETGRIAEIGRMQDFAREFASAGPVGDMRNPVPPRGDDDMRAEIVPRRSRHAPPRIRLFDTLDAGAEPNGRVQTRGIAFQIVDHRVPPDKCPVTPSHGQAGKLREMAVNVEPEPRVPRAPGLGDLVARVENGHRDVPQPQCPRGGKSGKAGPDHDDMDLFDGFHGLFPSVESSAAQARATK
jgi:hypothetical protein